ncbi:hypothetical protein ABEF95_007389 [Exophiala dermatitidis]
MGKLTSTIGIPIKLLNEAQGHVVTLELTSGQVYRGKLLEAEDNMNVQLKDITATARDGRVSHLDQVYIRGSHVRFFIVPDMLRNAPMFRTRAPAALGQAYRPYFVAMPPTSPAQAQPSSLRLLILAPTSEPGSASIPPFPALLEALTGSKPSDHVTSFTGYTSHPPLELRTKYYNSNVNIWCDEVPTRMSSQWKGPENQSTTQSASGEGEATPKPVQHDDNQDDTDTDTDTDTPTPSSLDEWKQQMLSSEAAEVRAVIGGIVLVLPVASSSSTRKPLPPAYYSLVEAVHELREAIEEETYGRDIASVVVLQSTSPTVSQDKLASVTASLEDEFLSERGILGWDFVGWNGVNTVQSNATTAADERGTVQKENANAAVRNEYGEKVGIERVIEVLEGVDWTVAPPGSGDGELGGGLDLGIDETAAGDDDPSTSELRSILGSGRFSGLEYELEREMMELKMSMLDHDHGQETQGHADADSETPREQHKAEVDEDEEFQVDQLQGLMERVVAIREAGSELSKTERERFARREIAKLMRDVS